MKKKQNKLTNEQLSSVGIKRTDNDSDMRANDLNRKNNENRTKNNK
jgi:hypothetical protein